MTGLCPSGQQVEISKGAQRAVVVEVGGGLRAYSVDGLEVLDGYPEDEMCSAGRGQALIPWPNRIDGGAYHFDGTSYQLSITEPARHTAIHGLTRFANWTAGERGADHVTMTHRLHPQPGYPFLLDLELAYELGSGGLTVTCKATNRGERACPYGTGAHPYLRLGPGPIDALTLCSPATEVLSADDRGIPTGRQPIDGHPGDFRLPRPIGSTRLDTAFTGLSRDDDRAVVRVSSFDSSIDLWLGPEYSYLMLFTGDSLEPGRRRTGLGVEPMTCAPNAFRSGDGLLRLQPGDSCSASWGIRVDG